MSATYQFQEFRLLQLLVTVDRGLDAMCIREAPDVAGHPSF